MDLIGLISMQGTLFLMILTGTLLVHIGIIDENAKKFLTRLCVNVVIPCNILKSFIMKFDMQILHSCAYILLLGVLTQVVCLICNKTLFKKYDRKHQNIMKYATIVSNGGFLGLPVAESVFGSIGALYTAVFLVPTRVIMWSVGPSYFIADSHPSKKELMKKILTHPCIVSVFIGIILMITQVPVPRFIVNTLGYIGNCNSPLTMLIIGTILADIEISTIFNVSTVKFCIFRLFVLPLIACLICKGLHMNNIVTGVAILMTGMPAGATTSIFADQYDSDGPFATKIVISTTLISMVTLPLWIYFVGV